MPHPPITTSGPTITVSTKADLIDAYNTLSATAGGGRILVEPGEYGGFAITTYNHTGGTEPVIIASADDDDPAHFTRIKFSDVDNIRVENVFVDSTGVDRPRGEVDLELTAVKNIQIVDSHFQHDTDFAIKNAGVKGEDMSLIRKTEDVLLENNYIDGYFHALKANHSTGLEIVGNELTNMQGDGFRGGAFEDLVISNNHMHNFYGTDQTLNHSDLIQIWGSDSDILTKNVTISGNILITNQAASQSIFIRNEEFGKAGDPTAGYFENIVVTDNIIYNAHKWGIHIANSDGMPVDGNTVLWNPDAQMIVAGDPRSYLPEIFIRDGKNAEITDNIVAKIVEGNNATVSGNKLVTYGGPHQDTWVGHHFSNPTVGMGADLRDLFLLPDSPWAGKGSPYGQMPASTDDNGVLAIIRTEAGAEDQYEITFDASLSIDGRGATEDSAGYTYHWTFADGSTAQGIEVTKLFGAGGEQDVTLEIRKGGAAVAELDRMVEVETKDVFAFDFEGGVVDISDATPGVINEGNTVNGFDGKGFLIGDGSEFQIQRSSDGLANADTFGLSMDLQPTGDEKSGVFLYMHKSMSAWGTDEGHFGLRLTTTEDTYSLTSREPVFDDGEAHRIGVAFNGDTGQLELFADGESVSETEAWGMTMPVQSWNLIFGNAWNDSMDAVVDNIAMSADTGVAGDLPVVDRPAPPPPAPAPEPPAPAPAPEPPAADPPPMDRPTPPDPSDPPAPTPPAPTPPASDPPAAPTPPSSEAPAPDDPGERGDEPNAVESDGGNFLSNILDFILAIFGLGGDDDEDPAPTTTAAMESDTVMLADIVPAVCDAEDLAQCDMDEDDPSEEDLAA